jgi:hypothetical protein
MPLINPKKMIRRLNVMILIKIQMHERKIKTCVFKFACNLDLE